MNAPAPLYMLQPEYQAIAADVEQLLEEIHQSVPEEEMGNVLMQMTAEKLCEMGELLMCLLATHEGYN